MTTRYGMPIWYELMTSDPAGAARFYGDIVGWKTGAFDGPGDYTLWKASDEAAVGGMLPMPPGMQGGPAWFAYFHVADVDAAVETVEHSGGTVHLPAQDVPGAGRFAMVADPQGVPFYVMTPPATETGTSTSFSPVLPQRCAWNELVTSDQTAALPFYAELFGWTSSGAMPMGEMGDYSFIECGDIQIGAMMNRSGPDQPVRWGFYFTIPDVDAAATWITDAGGQIIMGPMDVPGGQRALVAVDPQGAQVGFVSGDPA
ncbi:VOC family protein [Sphingomonas sp. PB2P19]|uniref:VOC family protein n=1 Tax=Sphingomonas rhamnosi TaxID=3096156 RepID=UPI002FC7FC90